MQRYLPRKVAALLVALMGCVWSVTAYNISGTLLDDEGEPVLSATVRLLAMPDSVQRAAVSSNMQGRFTIADVPNGNYTLTATFVGLDPLHVPVTVKGANVALGTLRMKATSTLLSEVTVKGYYNPIKVMQDTVEFSAAAYKTQPNAMVEDLLKRLPGVEVGSDGKITANGKQVSKILVDGKEFFADDPTVASRNLPVNMVDKLQVVDRKSDLARMTGVDDGEEETVINLTVKKGMNNGWFGNAEAGYGTDKRYLGNFNVNRFWNGNQVTILGAANNINQLGFSDGAAGRFRRFGSDNGITTSQSLGVNFNVGNDEIFRVGGDVMYSHSDRDTRQRSDRMYLFADSTSYRNSAKEARDKGHNLRADFRMQWKPDSFNTFEFRPRFSLNVSRSNSLDSALTSAGDAMRSPVTRSLNRAYTRGNSFETNGQLIYNHNFRSRPGRSLSLMAEYSFSNTRERSETYSWNKFYLLADSIDLYDQYDNNRTWSNYVNSRVTWTEPISRAPGHFLTLAYTFSYRWNNADKLTYDHPVMWPDGWTGEPVIDTELVFNPDLSNQFRNHYMNQDIRVGYKRVTSKVNLEVGLSAVPQMMESFDLINSERNIPERWTWNYAPFLRYRYRLGKTRSLNLNYRGRSSQPSMSQLQPVADMSDPLRIVVGNPDLEPSFTHNINIRFQDYDAHLGRSIMLMAFAQIKQNSIISRSDFNPETGGQVTTYQNVNGAWNIRMMNMFSMPFTGNKAFTFNNHLALSYDRSIGYQNSLRNTSNNLGLMESFSIAWRPDNVELELRPNYSLQHVTNSVQSASNRTVHTYGAQFNGTYYTPWGIVLGTDLNFSASNGYSAGYDTRQWLWNAQISYQFLKDKAATVTLKAYDLLQQRSNISRSVTANYIDDTLYNSLTRYFMVTFSYRFNTFSKGSEPRDRNMEEFERRHGAPIGPPPGARPPMGRPM